jgi:TonB family protein
VPLEKLHRLTGAQAIPPAGAAQGAAAGKPLGVAIVKVCLGDDGKVFATKLVKSSGVPAYDAQLESTIKATWTFEPVEIEGKPAPVCTQVTFLAH